ncbi:hypothetical protein CF386_07550 [Paraphotobacterium marinum]|uniref:Uncharacterized protein n=2 Tax=Paraphotobacterium marinum TaxID=1755811 RepID=A0A220VEU0_9GAMM|nr:hypothetical protein CF386_07550 [Paraphotobacterium marinum]
MISPIKNIVLNILFNHFLFLKLWFIILLTTSNFFYKLTHMKYIICLISSIAYSSMFLFSSNVLAKQTKTFDIIPPYCVWTLLNNHSYSGYSYRLKPLKNNSNTQKDIISEINLTECSSANKNFKIFTRNNQTTYQITFPRNDSNQLTEGYFSYQLVGPYKQYLIFHTFDSGGGTGNFDGIMIVKKDLRIEYGFNNKANNLNSQQNMFLKKILFIPGGDRATGGFKSLKIRNDYLEVTQYNKNNFPNNPQLPNKIFKIDLRHLK